MKRRLLAFLLAFLMVMTSAFALATPAQAATIVASGKAGTSVYWEVYDNGTLFIYGRGQMNDYSPMNTPVWNIGNWGGIRRVVISEGITNIGSYAFINFYELTEITIPSSVTTIGSAAFSNCYKLKDVHVASIGDWCRLTNAMGNLYDVNPLIVSGKDMQLYVDKQPVTEVVIPSGVREIAQHTFAHCTTITSVEIPDTVTTIGQWAFVGCEGLTSITVPDSVTSIGALAFSGCSGLQEMTLPFVGLGNPARFPFGAIFGSNGYDGSYSARQRIYDASGKLVRYETYGIPQSLSKVTITGDDIPIGAFESCYLLECVVLPENLERIPTGTFSYCGSLSEVGFPKNLKVIGSYAFEATGFGHFTVPDGVETIESNAFRDSNGIKTMIIPKSVTSIGSAAFYDLFRLSDIYFGGTEEEWAACCEAGTNAYVHYSCTDPTGHWTTESFTGDCTTGDYTVNTCPCGYETEKEEITEPSGHTWADATCTAPKTCSVCGATEGSAAGHKWTDATCTVAKTCSVCGVTEGDAAGHSWVDATCTVAKTCSVCGTTEGSALGHAYENGACARCGGEDPDFVPPATASGVTRLAGADRYTTAFLAADQLKAKLGVSKFNTIVVASGTDFADALSGSYLAAVKDAPMLLVRNNTNTIKQVKDYIKANLASGGTVYLLGGVNAVPKAMETDLDGFKVKRLGGATRYATNLLILNEAGVAGKDILVCTGKGFADSLSASAAKQPILLVKDNLDNDQKNFLSKASGKIYIIGGTSAVSTRIESQLKPYGTIIRLGGATRYVTSVMVAETFFKNPKSAVLAFSENFPDGLSGGALACGIDAPLILVKGGKDTDAAKYTKAQGIWDGYIMGGATLIPDRVVRNVYSMNANDPIAVK